MKQPRKQNQFLSFPNISSSNDLRGRSGHWETNTSGIAQGQTFSNFLRVGNETTEKKNQLLSFVIISSSN